MMINNREKKYILLHYYNAHKVVYIHYNNNILLEINLYNLYIKQQHTHKKSLFYFWFNKIYFKDNRIKFFDSKKKTNSLSLKVSKFYYLFFRFLSTHKQLAIYSTTHIIFNRIFTS
jgi:hypothetical protein